MMLLPEFEDIEYLKSGSPIQRKAYYTLIRSKILYHLQSFRPVLTGTLPLDIFLEGKSDLDIVCQSNTFKTVEKILLKEYAHHELFFCEQKKIQETETLLCRFVCEGFPFEIFCQQRQVKEQLAYRHMIAEYKLLQRYGEPLKNRVIELKASGVKTEPAFANALGLKGDPYRALLLFEQDLKTP